MRYDFAKSTLSKVLEEGHIDRGDRVLAVCAAAPEHQLLRELGFSNVTISNLDIRLDTASFEPFVWSYQDAQNLTFEDESFDVVMVADGLHHCASPHRALLEMYRVARKAVVVFESRDNALMRLANRFNLSPEYELEAVVGNGFAFGGVDNTEVPNYIYRWTEREFEKTLKSFDPSGPLHFRYFYGLNLPYQQAEMKKSPLKATVVRLVAPVVGLMTRVFKRQCNTMALLAYKPRRPEDLWPWLQKKGGRLVFDRAYAAAVFRVPAEHETSTVTE